MTKSCNPSPTLLKRIDALLIGDHPFLKTQDEVYYLGEYTNGKGAEFSAMNSLILNYKKDVKWEGKPGWKYKESAIKEVAVAFNTSIFQTSGFSERIKKALLIPIPPSKAKNDSGYDNRNLQMLNLFFPKGNIQELIYQKKSRTALHDSKNRDVGNLQSHLHLTSLNSGDFSEFWLFDDILRNGTHFRAISNLLQNAFPNSKVVGFFIARSVHGQ